MQVKVVQQEQKPKVENKNNGNGNGNRQHLIFRKLVDTLETMREEKFTGYIKINYTQGSIGRVERFEEILRK